MAKMNWDRVKKENQVRRSGSEWISSDDSGFTPEPDPLPVSPLPVRKAVFRRSFPARVPGCACNKRLGFVGQHRKKCPLRKDRAPNGFVQTGDSRVVREHPVCIKKQLSAVGDFLSSLQSQEKAGYRFDESHKVTVRRLIQVLQEELENASVTK
jgi:hypothetical protein